MATGRARRSTKNEAHSRKESLTQRKAPSVGDTLKLNSGAEVTVTKVLLLQNRSLHSSSWRQGAPEDQQKMRHIRAKNHLPKEKLRQLVILSNLIQVQK